MAIARVFLRPGSSGPVAGLVLTAGLLVAACGGKAVIDDPIGGGGAGGDSSTGSVSFCQTAAPVGTVRDCGGSAAVTSGGDIVCERAVCDDGGNTWTASCTGNGCACLFNGVVACTCSVEGADACSKPCCPAPFPL